MTLAYLGPSLSVFFVSFSVELISAVALLGYRFRSYDHDDGSHPSRSNTPCCFSILAS